MHESSALSALKKPSKCCYSVPLTVSVGTACALLDIGATKIWAMIASGQIDTIRVGRKRLIVDKSLENLIQGASSSAVDRS